MKFKTIDEVWKVLESGQKVYWGNKSYQVLIQQDYENKKYLRVTCMSNWFGSTLGQDELGQLFTDGSEGAK